ncbi:MAG: pyruvate dehydrogenase (acetyl-transferring), homodimeric type [Aquincola sp.]|uniref:Pyruvate dehydrogenase E1 component n=1 Tax=Aquincola tertiaricarbonis TaxID=391953 RepID=A0ABY4S735_AQUTE|nr:pyruvate dehydrogenase (acetyl-transferring), homodimeric type [Aquincola tertiaricarbonis]MBQ1765539.1 pyruvate dehydrogenase (acetyl-transferring), homodimeric type [Aquincola sp.]URI07847.1 pyruvate dehydrogenase (acetyl-transferring), homodimeric type [Aquincola tertiaricarbonis]|tara:strand:+ start:3859 stop:6537 length:2679 start_codon:yes stop_codon:yes gene_type:complete
MNMNDDADPAETGEWLDALKAVELHRGQERANLLVNRLVDQARRDGLYIPRSLTTAYKNTIPPEQEARSPGDRAIEHRLRSIIRWNALAIILRANKESSELGGHIASFQSAATLYDIGFGHFWHAPTDTHGGDLLFIQGHSSPGIYARAFLEGRLTEDQLLSYRQETAGKGLSSYPHPWLMPDFWQFPTVSMGLGPLIAIYQARFLKYLQGRGLAETTQRKVWAFMGDGEMDEPESLGAISLAGREHLDNLVFVINCNLQRLDGPVRGNGKIVQELESVFRGAGWNVIKVLWGGGWDALFAKDKSGKLLQLMEECVDGEYQDFKSKSGAYVREHFFGRYEETKALVADLSDDDIWKLTRGGHDPQKVFAAYAAAVKHTGQPTLILPKTVKGYGMGESGEGQMISHQAKKMTADALRGFRDRFQIPVSDDDLAKVPFIKLPEDGPEMKYLRERRAALGGYLPQRRRTSASLAIPPLSSFQRLLDNSGEREISTTMAFVQMLGTLVRDKNIGKHVVPIVPDESRTFGMEGMFRQLGIYSSVGQLYKPQDADQLMYYRESKDGQVLQEGINEGGAMSSWIVAATSYSTNNVPMIPFYIYYSMFGLQRVGDLAWLAGDMRARGFLLGGTAGRTTLNGEGLQHEDGHSHILAGTIPNCVSYDPTFAYEVVTIIRDGMRRMYEQQEDVYYYVTLMNENYPHPGLADAGEGAEQGILKGLYKLKAGGKAKKGLRVQLMGSGTILREVIAAAELLKDDWGVSADLWSATSYNELRRDGMAAERWNLLHPTEPRRKSWVETCLEGNEGPVIASTDYMRNYADQVREYVQAAGRRYVVLGTDGFGRSDYRVKLRRFFEVDRFYVTVAALKALADEGTLKPAVVAEAIAKYGLDTERAAPWTV